MILLLLTIRRTLMVLLTYLLVMGMITLKRINTYNILAVNRPTQKELNVLIPLVIVTRLLILPRLKNRPFVMVLLLYKLRWSRRTLEKLLMLVGTLAVMNGQLHTRTLLLKMRRILVIRRPRLRMVNALVLEIPLKRNGCTLNFNVMALPPMENLLLLLVQLRKALLLPLTRVRWLISNR